MECPGATLIGLNEFGLRLMDRIGTSRVPLTGSIELTSRCNLRCVHCYIGQPAADRAAESAELAAPELDRLFAEIAEEGCLWLCLTGGEPLLRKDFLDIYLAAIYKGLLVTVFTNGTGLTSEIADTWSEFRPFNVEITLYGATRETYELVTRVPGSYERCMRGIELLLERQIPLQLKTMMLTVNRHEVPAMKAFAESKGCRFHYDAVINSRLGGDRSPTQYRVPIEDVVAGDLADPERDRNLRKFAERFVPPVATDTTLYDCGAGLRTFHIDAAGRLSPCIMARQPSYDLRQGSFTDGWRNWMPVVVSQKWSTESPCRRCNLRALCGQCPGTSQVETGDQEAPVDYLCEIAHRRARAYGLKVENRRRKNV